MQKKIKAAVIGGSGLTGTELIKIILGHSGLELAYATSRTYKGKKIGEVFPGIGCSQKYVETLNKSQLKQTDVLFLCLPPHDSMQYMAKVLSIYEGIVIDVGSDFRLNSASQYKKWYQADHLLPDLLDKFVYGLPEVNRNQIKGANFIANPGCYPTSVLLALYPLLDSKLINPESLVIDSKSGISGAGRKLKEAYQFLNLSENFYAYSPLGHRHTGEIEQEIAKIYGKKLKVSFTPHLLPVDRGIFSSLYVPAVNLDEKKVAETYYHYYQQSLFVKYVNHIPQIRQVAGTNNCLIASVYDKDSKILKIFSVIDNLVKGAAGQAVQNMNIALGLEEDQGLRLQGIRT